MLVSRDDVLLTLGRVFRFFGFSQLRAVDGVNLIQEYEPGRLGCFHFRINRGVGFLEGFGGVTVFTVTETRTTQQSGGEHPNTTHD